MSENSNPYLHDAIAAFPFPGKVVDIVRYGEGHVHETYCVDVTEFDGVTRRYLLQKINTYAFKNVDKLMQNISLITAFLREETIKNGGDPDRESLTLFHARDGRCYYVDASGGAWRVYNFIRNSVSYQRIESVQQFYESAVAFGSFQKLLSTFDANLLHETIENFHNTADRLDKLDDAMMRDRKGRLSEVKSEIDFILQRKEEACRLVRMLDEGHLPLRVTHNDTKLNNILFDKDSNKPLAVIDLDTIMPGLAAYDFGDAIRFGCNLADEDEQDLDKVRFSKELYDAYVLGYLESAGSFLTSEEKKSLPWGAYIMTLENGIRFLTDYLEGDLYFHISRPKQNLDRSRTQLKLIQEMEAIWPHLEM